MNPVAAPAPVLAPPPLPKRRVRFRFLTVLAWCMVVASAGGCLVSFAAFLMVVAGGGHGTANASLSEGLVVIGLPPLTLIAGIGLLRRWRWSYAYALVLFGSVSVWNVSKLLRGPTPQHTYTSASGVPTTVLASPVDYPAHIVVVVVSLGLLGRLLMRSTRAEFWPLTQMSPAAGTTPGSIESAGPAIPSSAATGGVGPRQAGIPQRLPGEGPITDRARGWRVGHQGRDEMFYEEWGSGKWERIRLSGEMLMGRAHHVIYFASPESWRSYPDWAQHRREEIIARIKSVFCAPDYEYQGD